MMDMWCLGGQDPSVVHILYINMSQVGTCWYHITGSALSTYCVLWDALGNSGDLHPHGRHTPWPGRPAMKCIIIQMRGILRYSMNQESTLQTGLPCVPPTRSCSQVASQNCHVEARIGHVESLHSVNQIMDLENKPVWYSENG